MKQMSILISLLLFVVFGCNEKLTQEQGHSHSHGEEGHIHGADNDDVLSYTLYTDKAELFIEFGPLVLNHISNFAAHFTILGENFEPLREGQITISLVVGDKGIKNTANEPSSPGLYKLSLQPKKSGIGTIIFDIDSPFLKDQFIIEHVIIHQNDSEAHKIPHKEPHSDEVQYLKEQAWKIEFANKAIQKQNFCDVIRTSGQILSAAGDEVIVVAKASGIVMFSEKNTVLGTELNKGSKLFNISSADLLHGNWVNEYKIAKSNFEKAEIDYSNAGVLVSENIISQKEYLQVKLDYETAQTDYKNFSKFYSSGGKSIKSPMTGFVKNILVSEGQYVTEGAPLATISKNGKLLLQAKVSQKYFGKLSSINEANFKTVNSNLVYNTSELDGIVSYGKSADPNSPFIPVSFQINNSGELISGSTVEVFLKSSVIENALVVPNTSLIEEQGTFFIYVQIGGESFEKRKVKIGATDGINVEILTGLKEGERVVTKGAFQIKLSSAAGTIPAHGHTH